MTEHNHDDIFMDLDRLFKKASKLGNRISNLEYTLRDFYKAEHRIQVLEDKINSLEKGLLK